MHDTTFIVIGENTTDMMSLKEAKQTRQAVREVVEGGRLTVGEDALLHGEALLVIAASNAQHIALPLVAEGIGLHLLSHALLIEDASLFLVIKLKELLTPRSGEGNVQLWRRSQVMLRKENLHTFVNKIVNIVTCPGNTSGSQNSVLKVTPRCTGVPKEVCPRQQADGSWVP